MSKLADKLIGRTTVGYMDATEYLHELGTGIDTGIDKDHKIHLSIESLKKRRKCADACGIVKVEIKLLKWEQLPQERFSKFSDQD